jgi:hypothetical protein
MKHYSPTGRRNHGRPLKRLLDTWNRNGSTSGPTPWQIYDEDDDDDVWKSGKFQILRVILNEDNSNQIDLQERIKNANKTYEMLQKFVKNRNVSEKLKLTPKNTIIDKMLT